MTVPTDQRGFRRAVFGDCKGKGPLNVRLNSATLQSVSLRASPPIERLGCSGLPVEGATRVAKGQPGRPNGTRTETALLLRSGSRSGTGGVFATVGKALSRSVLNSQGGWIFRQHRLWSRPVGSNREDPLA